MSKLITLGSVRHETKGTLPSAVASPDGTNFTTVNLLKYNKPGGSKITVNPGVQVHCIVEQTANLIEQGTTPCR